MANQSRNGSAFEYAVCRQLMPELDKWLARHSLPKLASQVVRLVEDKRFQQIHESFNATPILLQQQMLLASKASWKRLFDMEPRIVYATEGDPLIVKANSNAGKEGDVRDVLFLRRIGPSHRRRILSSSSNWEIGISCKWNHADLKHPRLSPSIDFGKEWVGIPCSEEYWVALTSPMAYLKEHAGTLWSRLSKKEELVYGPILTALMNELLTLGQSHVFPNRLVWYLVGRYDFYKVIARVVLHQTDVQAFNLHGTLNQDAEGKRPRTSLSTSVGRLPTRLVQVSRKNATTISVILDRGWQFDLRVHNADRVIAPTVKLAVSFAGNPFESYTEPWATRTASKVPGRSQRFYS